MLPEREIRPSSECVSDAEIVSAIHYLEQDLELQRNAAGARIFFRIYFGVLAILAVVLIYIGVCSWKH
jgi:hypothetical protein